MGTRLTVFNQKGGVGKTTTVLNLGAALARRGGTPLLVDLDAQSHLSSILNPGAASGESLFAYYNVGRPLKEVARPVDRKSTRLNSSHMSISYAVFCLKKKNTLESSPTSYILPLTH